MKQGRPRSRPLVDKSPPQAQVACAVCGFHPLCHPRSTPAGAPSPVETRRRLVARESLYCAGEPNTSIYAVRAGFMKTSVASPAGGTHIARFLLPGDVAGLDGRANGVHQCDAVALADCEVCVIPAYRAEILSEFSPRIGAHLRRLLAEELGQSLEHAVTVACLTTDQRVSYLLLDLGRRWLKRGYSASAFQLPMSRREIANHLGLTAETVSRALSGFQARGWIRLQYRSVEILDEARLRALLAPGSGRGRPGARVQARGFSAIIPAWPPSHLPEPQTGNCS